jgi:hypothetical protein
VKRLFSGGCTRASQPRAGSDGGSNGARRRTPPNTAEQNATAFGSEPEAVWSDPVMEERNASGRLDS